MSRSLPFIKKPKNAEMEGMIGNAEFDPIGFSDYYDVKFLREAEIKHGRVSMLAVVGWLTTAAGIHLPSPNGIYDKVNPIDAFFAVGPGPIIQIILGVGVLEYINHNGKVTMMDMHTDSDRVVGEFSNPIYGASQLKGKSAEKVADLKLKELKNGRLAMIAIGGLVHQTIVTGSETLGTFPNSHLWTL
jgi:light-harvesting complex I chlorophyll a/b binding protein 4